MDKLNKIFTQAFIDFSESEFLTEQRSVGFIKYTYEESYEIIRKTISYLRDNDIKKGDRILIWSSNKPEYLFLFFACVLEGIVVVPMF